MALEAIFTRPLCYVLFSLASILQLIAAWDYKVNGADWVELGQCGAAVAQSPRDLPSSSEVENASTLFLKYPEITSSFQLYNNGYSIAFTLPEKYKAGFGLGQDVAAFKDDAASTYRLWQVNFHSPSEHSIDGKKMPLEMQLMHQRVTGGSPEIAVVVVFFADAANAYNDFLDVFATQLPENPWDEVTLQPPSIPFASVVGGSPFFHYSGSLTVPPCESNVKYFLRESPIPAANAQLTKFAAVLSKIAPKGNFRIMQTSESRVVMLPSVDLVNAPESVAKPRKSSIKSEQEVTLTDVADLSEYEDKGGHHACPKGVHDTIYKSVERIAVGDPDYLVDAKTRYTRAVRNLQAAEKSYVDTSRAYTYQKSLYDNAPGLVEKIHVKWALDNAQMMKEFAKQTKDGLGDSLTAPLAELHAAIEQFCSEKYPKKLAITSRTDAGSNDDDSGEREHYDYPEPLVKLPRGLAASPFTQSSDASSISGDSLNGVKIAPNLQQLDVPPNAAFGEDAEKQVKTHSLRMPKAKVLKITLPIDLHNMGDKGKFKKDLVDTLAKSAHISPDDFSISSIQDQLVPAVHEDLSMSQHDSSVKHKFLRAVPKT